MTEYDQARLFYLIILLFIVGGSFVFYYWRNLRTATQQFLLWGLIFFGLVTAYGFKDSFVRQLFPKIGYEVGETLVFAKSIDGHFYVQLTVNGQKVDFLVDTGATNLVLNRRTARKIGIDMDGLSYVHRAYTANGVTRSAKTVIDTIKLGSVTQHNVSASVNEGELDIPLLGMDYLKQFGELSIKGDKLVLKR